MSNSSAANPTDLGRASDNAAAAPLAAPAGRRSLATAVARGIALFLAAFSLLNLLIEIRVPGYDANLWWIDFAPLPPLVERAALFAVAALLIAYAFSPADVSPPRRRITRTAIELLTVVLAWNVVSYYWLLARGRIHSPLPVPFTLFVVAAIWAVWASVGSARPARGPVAWVIMAVTVAACAVVVPVLQMVCFGLTDYRRPADVAVVFGARVYDDGTPSDALRDRTQLAIDLYHQKLVSKLILSGGPNPAGVSETEAMRRMALDAKVKPEDVFTDPKGLNTDATVHNAILLMLGEQFWSGVEDLPASPRVLAVSHFYHLPRVKMAFGEQRLNVYTVPVREPLLGTRRYMAREVVALWKYYMEGLFPDAH